MSMSNDATPPIGLADGEVLSIDRHGTSVVVTYRCWDDRTLRAAFVGVVGLCDLGAHELARVALGRSESLFFCDVCKRHWVGDPPPNIMCFRFFDPDDQAVLEVVATGVEYTIEPAA
ncbi:MAG: hypothetical protein R3B68_10290 [Phycisphaerales bacterium]